MAELSFPFNSIGGDRRYKAEEFRQYFALLFCNGIFYKNANALKVVQGEGMTVQLNTGAAWADGCGYINTAPLSFTLDTADGALNRIDRIVLRCDYKERRYYAAVKKGTYSAQPTAPSIQRDADAYEQAIADIYVAKGAISITQANIADTRLNTELCGIVTGTVQQADTTEIFNQFEAYFEEFKQQYITEMESWTEAQQSDFAAWRQKEQAEFVEWTEYIKDILDKTAAGKLLNEIEKTADEAFKRHYGMRQQETEFLPDGSIVVTNAEGVLTVTKGTDAEGNKTITETLETATDTHVKTTTFLPATEAENKKIREEYTTL